MGKFDNIIIVSDIDFTFLAKDKSVPQNNLDAIKRFQSEGGRFTFATGRSHLTLLKSFPNAKELLNAPAVLSNGGYLYNYQTSEMISPMFLDRELALHIARFIYKELPDTGMRMLTPETTLYGLSNKYIEYERSQPWAKGLYTYQAPEDWTGENWFKIVVRDDPDKLDFLRSKIEQNFNGFDIELCKSESDFFEIQSKGCNKGRGIKLLKDNYFENGSNIKIYTCGDYENDLAMLREADVAVCPANAHENVKEICHMHLCSCDDGVIADLVGKL